MPTQVIDIHGKVKFIHAVDLSKYSKWSITIYPDEEGIKAIHEMQSHGLKNLLNTDKEDGGQFISFHREPTGKGLNGKIRVFDPPKVKDVEGNPIDGKTIGWGSDVIVKLETYKSTPKSMYRYYGARWDSLIVKNLIPYDKETKLEPVNTITVENKPEPLW